jgi:membrane-associated phospholipid phosphatase
MARTQAWYGIFGYSAGRWKPFQSGSSSGLPRMGPDQYRVGIRAQLTVFANLDLALADATIALYDAKYHYLVWRPVTAIQLGNTIGNRGIVGDPNWNPLAVTAADPSYPGAHATISQAAATVLSAFYGDHQQLTVSSDGDPGVTRTFGSFQAAANEATLSRLFAGQHTMIDLVAGQQLGRQVGNFVLGHLAQRRTARARKAHTRGSGGCLPASPLPGAPGQDCPRRRPLRSEG